MISKFSLSVYLKDMHIEHEVKFYPVDPDNIRERLRQLGATCMTGMTLQRRVVFHDNHHFDTSQYSSQFIRVRDEGEKITMTMKSFGHEKDGRTQIQDQSETEVIVSSFDDTIAILQAAGLQILGYQENKREKWKLDDCEYCIDLWPGLAPLLEIEGPDETSLRAVSHKLGFAWEHGIIGPVGFVYKKVFGIDIQKEPQYFSHLTFEKNAFEGMKKR